MDRSIVLVVEAVWKATGVLPGSPYSLFKFSRVDINGEYTASDDSYRLNIINTLKGLLLAYLA